MFLIILVLKERCGFPNILKPDLLSLPAIRNIETWEKGKRQKDAQSVEEQNTYSWDICRSLCQHRNRSVKALLGLTTH